MTGEPVPPARGTFGEDPSRSPSAASPMAQGLERLRARIRERLDQIEALALERPPCPLPAPEQSEPSERERELHRRLAEVEETQRRLRIEADRWDKERQAAAEQLEHDRRLLAEAWERLEREQIEAPAAAHASARPAPAERPAPAVVRAAIPSDHDDPVAQAILKQFQTLRRDVRRNANGQCPG